MSYPQQTTQNSGMLPNGILPQMLHHPQQQQQQHQQKSPQQPVYGNNNYQFNTQPINKFLPPTSQPLQQQHQQQSINTQTPPGNKGNYSPANMQHQPPKLPPQQHANVLTNGGSSHSSRTASPALNNSLNQSFLPPPRPGATSTPQSQFSSPNIPPPQRGNFMPPTSNPNVLGLSGSMQNLSIGQQNANGPLPGPPQTPVQPPPLSGAAKPPMTSSAPIAVSSSPSSFPMNFKPLATNAGNPAVNQFMAPSQPGVMPPKPVTQSNQQTMMPPPPAQSVQSPRTNGLHASSAANFPPPPALASSLANSGSTPATMPSRPTTAGNTNNPAVLPANRQPPLMTSPSGNQTFHQFGLNNNNNNQQQYQQQSAASAQPQQPNQFAANQQQQMPPATVRKPMYPSQQQQQQYQQLPPMPPLNQQSQSMPQQTYQSASFNGQQNTGPLQYQQQQYPQQSANYSQTGSVVQQGFNRLWGQDTVDLMQNRHILPQEKVPAPPIKLNHTLYEAANCSPDIFRCTVTKIPESNSLLQKSRLPLGILIHPFRDLNHLPVIQCATIVRCRLCRTYINPFVYFVDSKKWKCNLCYRINELPEEFQYDPVSKSYGDVTRRPEVKASTIEFIAPSEYMLRPPQPAIYLFLLDVSILAQQSGYLEAVCSVLSDNLDTLPGDARTRVGFIAYNSAVHFYNIAEGFNQPHEITVVEIDDVFLPSPDNLLINLNECKELIKDLLNQMPTRFANSHDSGSALGAALQAAFKLMSSSGGRVTIFQTCLPNIGPGALQPREDPNNRSARDVAHLGPATDFYKRQALECSGQQIAVDLFLLNQQYSDLATLSGVCKYSGGCIHHFPLYQKTKPHVVDSFKRCLERYFQRKIGFEAVMRVRCTRGLQIHTFHGNFFVRSTDLLSLPNVNPDAGYGMQISYDESLTDVKSICFQAALLYTSSKGERRIRVHTLCLPVTTSLSEVLHSADTECIIGLLSKMAVDRCLTSTVSDARDAFINATVDIFSAFKLAQNLPQGQTGQLLAPQNLSLLPLYILALLKHLAFRTGTSTRLDDRVFAMDSMKTLPLDQLMKYIYPEFYLIDCLFQKTSNENENNIRQEPPLLQLTAEYLDSRSMFLIDSGTLIIIYVGLNVQPNILKNVLGVQTTAEIPDYCYDFPTLNTPESEALQTFIDSLNEEKPYLPIIQIIRDTSTSRSIFNEKLVDDRSEASLSYYEFLQHLRTQVK